MTRIDWQSFQKVTHCHICEAELSENKVRNHCHLNRKIRGAAHNDFNISYKFSFRIPVEFHNLRGYDTSSQLIMQAILKVEGK